jgi:hypothetical protein
MELPSGSVKEISVRGEVEYIAGYCCQAGQQFENEAYISKGTSG